MTLTDEQKERINYTMRGYSKRRLQTLHLAVPSEPHEVRFWMNEKTTEGFRYVVLPGTHHTKEGAERAQPKDVVCQAVEYKQGKGNEGPERV